MPASCCGDRRPRRRGWRGLAILYHPPGGAEHRRAGGGGTWTVEVGSKTTSPASSVLHLTRPRRRRPAPLAHVECLRRNPGRGAVMFRRTYDQCSSDSDCPTTATCACRGSPSCTAAAILALPGTAAPIRIAVPTGFVLPRVRGRLSATSVTPRRTPASTTTAARPRTAGALRRSQGVSILAPPGTGSASVSRFP